MVVEDGPAPRAQREGAGREDAVLTAVAANEDFYRSVSREKAAERGLEICEPDGLRVQGLELQAPVVNSRPRAA